MAGYITVCSYTCMYIDSRLMLVFPLLPSSSSPLPLFDMATSNMYCTITSRTGLCVKKKSPRSSVTVSSRTCKLIALLLGRRMLRHCGGEVVVALVQYPKWYPDPQRVEEEEVNPPVQFPCQLLLLFESREYRFVGDDSERVRPGPLRFQWSMA